MKGEQKGLSSDVDANRLLIQEHLIFLSIITTVCVYLCVELLGFIGLIIIPTKCCTLIEQF